ncbi:MAG: AAA-like domain-containing protein [Gammaproteobacteria bacterium]|nr:AAA-like domain-containing protein [Gammaproteobacteria bacterium]
MEQRTAAEPALAGDFNEQASSDEREQLDATGEFFSVGAPLHAVRAGYIRRNADDLLYETVISGRYAHVLAPDRSGKSSLIAATAARLENNGCKIAVLDLQQIGVRDGGGDPGRWYYNIAYRLLRQLRIRHDLQSWWQDKSVLSNRQRLVEFYSEVILQFVPERIVVFVDEIQCIEEVPFDDQLLASIRAAHNARTTDPDFSRLSFVLLGECDPVSLVEEAELSPFNVTAPIPLNDFTREELNLFATELNLGQHDAAAALDRIFHWTRGQPYLSQKLARAIAREGVDSDIVALVDRVATRQIAGRAALHSEPHMSHIHRAIVNDIKRKEPLLNLYGKIRKGVEVAADLGSPMQRRLMAVGLLEIDEDGTLRVRNRLYDRVFTARWANENLPVRLKVPALVIASFLLLALIPFWYTQWLPRPYVAILASPTIELETASDAYRNLRSFPGHADIADNLYRVFLTRRARLAAEESELDRVVALTETLPDAGRLPEVLAAEFWDRKVQAAKRQERRDDALIASLKSLVTSTPRRRQVAANLIADDYPMLLASLPAPKGSRTVFDPVSMLLTSADGARLSQWSYATENVQQRDDWSVTALDVIPLVRRVVVSREGVVNRVGLSLTISHARLSDLRIKIIAPSGRTIEVETGLERASSNDTIRIAPQQLRELIGESLAGTWTVSVRDENLGIAGQFVGWNLKLNSQGNIEEFQRGLNIPEPVERETDSIWFDASGRYAVARAMQSDSARIWDLAFAEPVRAIAVNENEILVGLDAGARRLVTATQDSVNLWDTASGDRVASMPVGFGSSDARLTADGTHLFVERRSDVETKLEVWSLDTGDRAAEVSVAGAPSLVVVDPTGSRVATADYDRAVRVWEFATGELHAQLDLPAQPSAIQLAAGGTALGVIYGNSGVSLWSVDRPQQSLLEQFGAGRWQLVFSPSGSSALVGRPDIGFQMYGSRDGRHIGPPVGVRRDAFSSDLLAYSHDEKVIVTGSAEGMVRIWNAPAADAAAIVEASEHEVWKPSADRVLAATPDATRLLIGDPAGHVHVIPAGASLDDLKIINDDVSFVGHNADVRVLSVNASGSLAASAASDNSIRIWNTASGQPLPHIAEISGAAVTRMVFSPDSSLLGVLNDDRVWLLAVESGDLVAEFDLGESHAGIAFANDERLFVGGASGSLRLINLDGEGGWSSRQVWKGAAPIRALEASPGGKYLILIDSNNLASQFILAEGRIADHVLQLPAATQDVTFGDSDSHAMFRTSRWVHRASSSMAGLIWQDSVFVPRVSNGARIVPGKTEEAGVASNRLYLPAVRNGFVELVELAFRGSSNPGLFGNKDELLQEWQTRLTGNAVPEGG